MPKPYPQMKQNMWKKPSHLHILKALQLLLIFVQVEPGRCHPQQAIQLECVLCGHSVN